MTKLKNLNCDKLRKIICYKTQKAQRVTKQTKISNCDKAQPNLVVTKLKNWNCDSSDSSSSGSSNSDIFSSKELDTSPADEIFSGQFFAIVAMFYGIPGYHRMFETHPFQKVWSLKVVMLLQAST